jgi:phosphoribosylformylglycinamidine synthase subunit PurL
VLPDRRPRRDRAAAADLPLFGEGPGGFVVSGDEEALRALPGTVVLGTVGGAELRAGGASWTLAELREAWSALAPLFP